MRERWPIRTGGAERRAESGPALPTAAPCRADLEPPRPVTVPLSSPPVSPHAAPIIPIIPVITNTPPPRPTTRIFITSHHLPASPSPLSFPITPITTITPITNIILLTLYYLPSSLSPPPPPITSITVPHHLHHAHHSHHLLCPSLSPISPSPPPPLSLFCPNIPPTPVWAGQGAEQPPTFPPYSPSVAS